jgi:hypothetical protein
VAWNPEENLSSGPLAPDERRDVRRVLRWYERKIFFQASAKVWAMWLFGLPPFLLGLWEFVADVIMKKTP